MRKKRFRRFVSFLILGIMQAGSCSFNYENQPIEDSGLPDIVMENLDYARVRGGFLQARFQADRAEQYEKRRLMTLNVIAFEQYNRSTGELDAKGTAGSAEVELSSGNVTLRDGINLSVESEELTLETEWLEWKDAERTLKGGEENQVAVKRDNGTDFRGTGFFADVGTRKWDFSGGAEGTLEEDEKAESAEDVPGTEGAQSAGQGTE
jgi:LPS export ABC transporter protein LptC